MNDPAVRRRVGWLLVAATFAVFGGAALWVDPVDVRRTPADPTATPGFQSDEATYYLITHSLVHDFDLEYRQEDLERSKAEFPLGPSGVFLKRGRTLDGEPDPDVGRLYFGKSFAYSLLAAPFVLVFGTTGFYVLNAALLALAIWCAYAFLSARSGIAVSAVVAIGFLIPTVVPVYWSWIQPELFNMAVGMLATLCWTYKLVAREEPGGRPAWLWSPASDLTAAALIGFLTFSKLTNAVLGLPLGLYWLWRRDWKRAALIAVAFAVTAGAWFGTNVWSSGEWNYQGGHDRRTCYEAYPFDRPGVGLDVCDERATNEAQTEIWFDPEAFADNMRANLTYFFVGRYSGLVPYFFPGVVALGAFLFAGRHRRTPWQWFVLAAFVAQVLAQIVITPYSYYGGGGSVGNRYFIGAYGLLIFLMPPVRHVALAALPWLGSVFMAPLVLSPFDTSARPGDRGFAGPLRLFPVELTNFNDLPVMTERGLMLRLFGAAPGRRGFQLVYLDKNSYLQEADGLSFWARGRARAELLVRTNEPEERLELTLSAGSVPVTVRVNLEGRSAEVALAAQQSAVIQLAPGRGFLYKGAGNHSYIWRLSIETDNGWVPAEREGGHDTRFLGVRVKPLIVP